MSDLQEVIVNSAVKAFNQGYLHGRRSERTLILEEARKLAVGEDNLGEFLYLRDLVEHVEDVTIA